MGGRGGGALAQSSRKPTWSGLCQGALRAKVQSLPARTRGWVGTLMQTCGPAREMTGRCLCTAGSLDHRLRCLQKDHCFSGLSTEAAAGTPLPPPGISQAAQVWAGTGGGESQALSVSSARPLPAGIKEGCGQDSVGAQLTQPCFPTSPSAAPVEASAAQEGTSESGQCPQGPGVSEVRAVTGSQR